MNRPLVREVARGHISEGTVLCWITLGTKVRFEICMWRKCEVSVVLMRSQAAEDGVDGDQKGEFESRPTMRAFGRSASTKIKQGLDWSR